MLFLNLSCLLFELRCTRCTRCTRSAQGYRTCRFCSAAYSLGLENVALHKTMKTWLRRTCTLKEIKVGSLICLIHISYVEAPVTPHLLLRLPRMGVLRLCLFPPGCASLFNSFIAQLDRQDAPFLRRRLSRHHLVPTPRPSRGSPPLEKRVKRKTKF